jgi:hypothetical protein
VISFRPIRSAGPALLASLCLPLAPVVASVAPAQAGAAPPAVAADSGGFVVRLGRDTVGIERFVRTGRRVEGWHLWRSPRAVVTHWVLETDATGRPTRLESERRPAADTAGGQHIVTVFGTDSAVVTVRQGDGTRALTAALAKGVPVAAMVPMTFALYEQLVRQAMAAGLAPGGAGVTVAALYAGQREASPTTVERRGRDSVLIGFFGAPFRARVDEAGRILALDGSGTTMALDVRRVPALDFEGIRRDLAVRETSGRAMGQLSPRDTARATIGGATLLVDYGRPAKRGRRVFGNLVPYGRVWRTGANAATHFRTSREIAFGNTTLPAGTYTLWTVPTEGGATLVVNKQTQQWGTDYDESQDLLRVPMTTERSATPVEQFTITIETAGDRAGTIVMRWDDRVWRAGFTVR